MLRDHWLKWFERRIQLGRNPSRRRRAGKRLQVVDTAWVAQALEDRTLLATYTVDSLGDVSDGDTSPGNLTLREAIELANTNAGADTINFKSGPGGFAGQVITLTQGPLTITDDLTITGFNNPVVVANGGLILQASGAGVTRVFNMTGVGVNASPGQGLLVEATNDALLIASISNAFFNNSGAEGVKLLANRGGEARMNLTGVTINANGKTVPSAGMSVDVGVAAPAVSPTVANKFATVKLTMTDVDMMFNALEGLDVDAGSGGKFQTTSPLTDLTFQGNGGTSARDHVNVTANGAQTSVDIRFDTVVANKSKKSGFNIEASGGALVTAVINNATANDAASDALGVLSTGAGSSVIISATNFTGDGAALFGLDLDVNGGAQARFNNFNNVSLQNSGRGGIDVDLVGGSITAFNASNVNTSGGLINGVDLFLRQGTSVFTFNGLTSNNNVERGLQITSIVSANSNVTINNLSAVGNQTKQPVNIVVNNKAILNLDVNGGTVSSAGGTANNSIFSRITNQATGNLSFDGLTVNNSTSSAFVTRYDTNAKGHFEIKNTTATGSMVGGMGLNIFGGAQVTGNFDNFNVSNSGQGATSDAFRVEVNGHGTTANFALNQVIADNSSRNGISVKYYNRATGAITKFDNISAQNAEFNGLQVEVRGIAQLTSFVGDGINLSGAGQSGSTSHNGLSVSVLTAGTGASFNFQNLTADNAAGRGIVVSAQDASTTQIVVDGFSANNNGLQGLNLVIGTSKNNARLVNSAFRNGSFSGNGTSGSYDGVRTRVTGPGSRANLVFDNVSADGNSASGHDALVSAGGDYTLQVDNTSSFNSNFLNGLRFVATGASTKAALTSTVGGNTFNDNNDNGLFVELLDGVTVSDLTIRGGASFNRENGAVIDIDDRSGVTVNNLLIGDATSAFSGNDLTGLVVRLDSVLGLKDLAIDGITASNNLGGATGINALIKDMTLDNVSLTNFIAEGNNGDGLTLLLDGVTVNNNFDVTGFEAGDNDGDGAEIALVNATKITGTMSVNGTSSGNGGDGAKILANDGSGVSVGAFAISGSALTVNGNEGNGLTFDFNNVAGITSFNLSGMEITDNEGDQVFARFKDMPAPIAFSFDDASATGPGAANATGDGIDLIIDNSTASSLSLKRIDASENGGDGLKLTLLNGASIPATSIDVGTFDNNGGNGIGINLTNSTASIGITNSTFQLLGTVASASGNGRDGVAIRLDNATLTMNTVDHINFDDNGRIGFNVEGATPSTFISSNGFTNNTVTGNGSFGWRGVFNGGNFDVSIGSRSTAGQGNVFNNNGGAGISLDMIQNSIGHMTILDNIITNTGNDNDPLTQFTGEGIFVRMLGTANPAQATNTLVGPGGAPGLLIKNNRIGVNATNGVAGNAGDGIDFQVEEQSSIQGLHIHDNRVDNNGLPTGGDGLNFRRLDEVIVSGFQILRNTFNKNGDDGIEILGQNDDNSEMQIEFGNNELMENGNDGVALQVNAEAGLNIDMHDNTIVKNGDDGLQMTEVILAISDNRRIVGSVRDNVISENANRGVNSSAVTSELFSSLVFSDNTIGELRDQFNQIIYLGNGSTGVEINGAGASIYFRNDIRGNGRLVPDTDRTTGHGIDIQGAGFKDIYLVENLIRENKRDGIEFQNDGATFSFTLNMVDNRVQSNGGRGLDILNRSSGTDGGRSYITIYTGTTGNVFNSNGEEGIYAVNTASSTQTQDVFANAPLLQDGNVDADPRLSLVIDDATISNNGSPENVPNMVSSAGVVIRVGSSDASSSTVGANEFATLNFLTGGTIVAPVIPSFINGGVFTQLTNSTMAGNFGNDVFFHGYRSTVNPGDFSGTWSATEFNITGGDGDPLARLDLLWFGNSYQSIDVNNSNRLGTPDGQAGAFYNDGAGTFKSRLDNATPPGPFTSATRRRNAQRVPTRGALAPPPADPGTNFAYPGMGESTFRLATGSDPSGFGATQFTAPIIGELSFAWGTY